MGTGHMQKTHGSVSPSSHGGSLRDIPHGVLHSPPLQTARLVVVVPAKHPSPNPHLCGGAERGREGHTVTRTSLRGRADAGLGIGLPCAVCVTPAPSPERPPVHAVSGRQQRRALGLCRQAAPRNTGTGLRQG